MNSDKIKEQCVDKVETPFLGFKNCTSKMAKKGHICTQKNENGHIHKYIYIKVVRTNFLWVLNFGQVGGSNKKIQKHPLGWIFLKSY